jgi:hypothetical protein
MREGRSVANDGRSAETRRSLEALRSLREHFLRNGYLRSPPDRDKDPATHRGHELRFAALTDDERDQMLSLLGRAGVETGKPFLKGAAWRIPIYGRDNVEGLIARMFPAKSDGGGMKAVKRARNASKKKVQPKRAVASKAKVAKRSRPRSARR